jgi:twitching motility protein PilT
MARIDSFFKVMVDQQASDMHLAVGYPPILRIHGSLRRVDYPPLTDSALRPMLYEVLTEKQIERFEKKRDLDFSYTAPDIARFRANFFMKNTGLAAVFRRIPLHIASLDQIGAPARFKSFGDFKNGLILVTGPTGSGKSTTLAAIIDHINRAATEHVITLEDPLEFIHQPVNCVISQREIGTHSESFASGLRSALREDPDVILVGEMRDLETIQLAISAAETGHLVLGSLHTTSAAKTVDRIIDVFPPDRQPHVRTMLSESLRAVVSQQLVLRADGNGRVAAFEVMLVNSAIRTLIREQKTFQISSVISTSRKEGMQTLDQALRELVQKSVITADEAARFADAPTSFGARTANPALEPVFT